MLSKCASSQEKCQFKWFLFPQLKFNQKKRLLLSSQCKKSKQILPNLSQKAPISTIKNIPKTPAAKTPNATAPIQRQVISRSRRRKKDICITAQGFALSPGAHYRRKPNRLRERGICFCSHARRARPTSPPSRTPILWSRSIGNYGSSDGVYIERRVSASEYSRAWLLTRRPSRPWPPRRVRAQASSWTLQISCGGAHAGMGALHARRFHPAMRGGEERDPSSSPGAWERPWHFSRGYCGTHGKRNRSAVIEIREETD